MGEPANIAIVGAGTVGTALGVLASGRGWSVAAIADRNSQRAAVAAERVGCRACQPAEAAGSAELVLLTVSDDAIGAVCADLARSGAFRRGAVVVHCSGALASDVLAPARQRCGCAVASMHPLQTFPSVDAAVDRLDGAFFFCEGDDAALTALWPFVTDLGGTFVLIDPAAKTLYHAAAVMASNHLVALLDAALALQERAGIDRQTARPAMAPLIRATVENVLAAGPAAALTGPVARGDADTIRRHLDALADGDADLAAFYRAAARWTARVAEQKGTPGDDLGRIRELLDEAGPG